jgi:hypothetical protein
MEALFAVLRSAVENGWRFGLVLLLVGIAVPLLDHFDIPKPGALKEWIGPSTVFALVGLAVLITSLVGTVAAHLQARYRRADAMTQPIQDRMAQADEAMLVLGTA